MGVTSSNKQINTDRIGCDGSLRYLGLDSRSRYHLHPTDIVLALDRSGSMAGSPLAT